MSLRAERSGGAGRKLANEMPFNLRQSGSMRDLFPMSTGCARKKVRGDWLVLSEGYRWFWWRLLGGVKNSLRFRAGQP